MIENLKTETHKVISEGDVKIEYREGEISFISVGYHTYSTLKELKDEHHKMHIAFNIIKANDESDAPRDESNKASEDDAKR